VIARTGKTVGGRRDATYRPSLSVAGVSLDTGKTLINGLFGQYWTLVEGYFIRRELSGVVKAATAFVYEAPSMNNIAELMQTTMSEASPGC
jgi:hypothetical protein